MKILYLIKHLAQTGVNNVVLDLVRVFAQHGHECTVAFLEESEHKMAFPCPALHINSVDIARYDVLHAHGLGPMLWVAKQKMRGLEKSKPKLITTLHCYCFQDLTDTYSKPKGILMSLAFLATARIFDHIVCLSKDMMHYYERWLPTKRLCYAYNTRDIDTTFSTLSSEEKEELLDFKDDSTLIGMNCVLLLRKGIDVMLEALALLPNSYKLFIVGDGKERAAFELQAESLGVRQRVCFAGRRDNAHRYLPYFDIYALPSRSEGFPLSLLEAAAYGCKVVASRLPIVKECFSENEMAMFDMPDAKALAEAISSMEGNYHIGAELQELYNKAYAPSIFYHSYLKVYTS